MSHFLFNKSQETKQNNGRFCPLQIALKPLQWDYHLSKHQLYASLWRSWLLEQVSTFIFKCQNTQRIPQKTEFDFLWGNLVCRFPWTLTRSQHQWGERGNIPGCDTVMFHIIILEKKGQKENDSPQICMVQNVQLVYEVFFFSNWKIILRTIKLIKPRSPGTFQRKTYFSLCFRGKR